MKLKNKNKKKLSYWSVKLKKNRLKNDSQK
jgi:hypothetical protein